MNDVEWRNFRKHLEPRDEKDQGRINKRLCEYIYELHTEIMSLKKDQKRRRKNEEVENNES